MTDKTLYDAASLNKQTAAAVEVTDPQVIPRSNDLLGRMIDTFVASQLRSERTWATQRSGMYHLRRDPGTREIDIVTEVGGDKVVAVELKATASPNQDDARHLCWLAEQLGDRFVGEVVLHTGPRWWFDTFRKARAAEP